MEKQTIEDAANKYSPDPLYNDGQWEFGDVIDGFKAGAEWQKEQLDIPTDEEIEKKAKICVDETWAIYQARPNYKSILRTFKNGYKQALKDLGYE